MMRRLIAALAPVLVAAGCVSPAPSTGAYEGKAAQSAADAVSSARTAVLAVATFERGNLTTPALDVLLQESEQTLDAISGTFASVQPPDTAAADATRAELDPLLAEAGAAATELRIAARRGEGAILHQQAQALAATADQLERFEQGLGS